MDLSVGREDNTEFTISSLPACVRKLEHVCNLLSTLLTSGMISTILGLVSPIGSPKYVKGNSPS